MSQSNTKSKRKSERRDCDQCVTLIDGKTYPVYDWSAGGIQIFGDARPFAVNTEVDVTMKFKLRGKIVDVSHKAKIVRKGNDRVAFQFQPITEQMQKTFRSVVDDYVASRFADSQAG